MIFWRGELSPEKPRRSLEPETEPGGNERRIADKPKFLERVRPDAYPIPEETGSGRPCARACRVDPLLRANARSTGRQPVCGTLRPGKNSPKAEGGRNGPSEAGGRGGDPLGSRTTRCSVEQGKQPLGYTSDGI